ncbi:hypothetical protein L6164_008189 [Bauhinia variegata]|uniref:Uncharacterized protein n=1 Tax=Bauhinia variegata TaxID=167791 RepID=A0ACB9PFX2_BAUVA|nr:hypothetical protein L6164_008189 [Bauhinia variegata]
MQTAFLALFFFLFAFATAEDTVLDTDGNPVANGSQYYMLPATKETGGGFKFTRTENEKCPLSVVQASSELSKGLPVIISPRQGKDIIPTGWYVDVQFVKAPNCAPKPSVWCVPPDSYSVKIRTDGRFSSDFTIEKASEDGYKFMHCPSHPRSCREIGIVIDEGKNRLLKRGGENPLIVRFKKAKAQN